MMAWANRSFYFGERRVFLWCERKQRDGSGKKGNSTFSFFNLKFSLDNINEKN
jgi:hypothetical protein